MLHIENAGTDIISTNFWDLDINKKGKFFLSINAGAFRLLVPEDKEAEIKEMKTAKLVIISQGFWREANSPAFEILFEDYSDNPYVLYITTTAADRSVLEKQQIGLTFSVWIKGCKKVLELPCNFRQVSTIPYLKEWED